MTAEKPSLDDDATSGARPMQRRDTILDALVEVETLSQSGHSGVTVSAPTDPDALMRQITKGATQ